MTIYTKDALISTIIEQQKTTTQFMERITASLEALNDNNILHRQAIDSSRAAIDINSKATNDMTGAIRIQSAYLKLQANYVKWIGFVLVAAIVILAGAEKALKFLPIFK